MGSIVRPHSFSDGAVARPDQVNENETILYNEINGNLDWDNLKAALVNAANGLVKLDANAKVPVAQLPTTIPSGVIVMWSGTLGTIPAGWSLCDGTGGTPDLRDKFIYGWSDGVDPGGTGGAATHTHTYSDLPEHGHGVSWSHGAPGKRSTVNHFYGSSWQLGCHTEWGFIDSCQDAGLSVLTAGVASPETDVGSTLPPYFKLAFIIKD